jgi:hypothetical protein
MGLCTKDFKAVITKMSQQVILNSLETKKIKISTMKESYFLNDQMENIEVPVVVVQA